MGTLLYNYCLYISLAGFFVLLIFSIMSFTNVEALQITKGKNKNSGIILLICSIVILQIFLFLVVWNYCRFFLLFNKKYWSK